MLGLTRREVAERFDAIVAFAELEPFIDAPVKTYSSGMYMRLGFSVAIHVEPDVLLIDEVLAVGDEAFTRKCLDKIGEFRRRGKTIVLVTHSLGLVEKMCDDVLWLRRAQVADRGDPKRVVDAYLTYVAGGEEALLAREHGQPAGETPPSAEAAPGEPAGTTGYRQGRWGSHEIEIAAVRLLDDRGQERHVYVPGERLTIAVAGDGQGAGRPTSCSGSASSPPTASPSTGPTPISRSSSPPGRKAGARCACTSTTCGWWRERTCWTWPSTAATGRRTTTIAGCTRSG